MIRQIKLVPLFVTNIERAIEFYQDKLGFKITTDVTYEGGRWIELTIPGSATMLSLTTSSEIPGPEFQGICFETDDIEQTYNDLVTKGVHFEYPPALQSWGEIITEFYDPDGNHFILGEGAKDN